MVANNPYLIPQVEEVRYLNTEVPSYEEFLRNYKVDQRVKNSYESEINAYSELGKGYGPGLWDDIKKVGKVVGSAVLTTGIIATGPAALPLSVAGVVIGAAEKEIAENSEGILPEPIREHLEFVGDNSFNGGANALAILTLGKVNVKK